MSATTNPHLYENFEIRVGTRDIDGYRITVSQTPAGDANAVCHLDPEETLLQHLLSSVTSPQANETTLLQLGNLLFDALFTGNIATLYRSCLSLVRSQGKQLRIRLTIEPPALAVLPWEFLHDALEDVFLAISTETALVRYVPIQTQVHPTAVSPPLRILVAIASPIDLQPLDVAREQDLIREALAERLQQGSVHVQFLKEATIPALSQAMRTYHPHIFHFIGHSCFENDQAFVLLEDDNGFAKAIDERTFRELFTGFPETRLAVLNACQTAVTTSQQPLVGLAPRLLQRQLSAVVAMQYSITDSTSLIFTREFYRSLALGYPVEAAISEARRGIFLEVAGRTLDWGIPVLFLRAQDGQLFATQPSEKTTPLMSTFTSTSVRETNSPAALPSAKTADSPVRMVNKTLVGGSVATDGGDFTGRDKITQGDAVRGDKIGGNKTEVHIDRVESGAQVFLGPVQLSQSPPLTIAPPPEPKHPPQPSGFVGRAIELAYYAEKLTTTGIAVICGMAGVGKSALAAELAMHTTTPDRVFWHTFHEDEGFSSIIWQLAGFLAWHGQDALWQMLQRTQQAGGELPPPATLFNYLLQMVRRQHYLFCLDDFQFVDDDPVLMEFVAGLGPLLSSGDLTLIITARRLPDFIQTTEITALGGLSEGDTHNLLTSRGLSLSGELLSDLHAQTAGNAQLLMLVVNALQRTSDPKRLIAHLVEATDVERYLMDQVDQGLSKDERSVMMAVAVFLGYPCTRQAIETIWDGDSLYRPLYDLSSQYLLLVGESEQGREYSQHATLQTFYYAALGQRERQALHHRCGTYYEAEQDMLKAARHFQRAGEYAVAARLATTDIWKIINQGQARALCNLLARFASDQLELTHWLQVTIARGQTYALLGEGQLALTNYQEALTQIAGQPDAPEMHRLRARICRGMGALLERESPQVALTWLRRGLDEQTGAADEEKAALHIQLGSVLSAVGDFDQALISLNTGLALLPTSPSQLRARALVDLSNIYSAQGDIAQGNVYAQQALKISHELHDDYLILAIRHNQGIDKETAGQWQAAIVDHQAALALAEQLGSVVDQVEVANSLGTLYTKLGENEQAFSHLTHTIELARAHNLRESLGFGLTSLAELHIAIGDSQVAAALLDEAEQVALQCNTKYLLAAISFCRGQLHLDAQLDAERSLCMARELELELEEGKYLRLFGQTQAANGQYDLALTTLAQSYDRLANRDPYEAARTQMVWGRLLLLNGKAEEGHRLLGEASTTFDKLGARRDLLAAQKTCQMSFPQ